MNGKITFFTKGEVAEFKKCPPNFRPLTDKIDFTTASEAELLEAKWKFSDAFNAVKEEYGVELKKTDKADIVAQILDARYRQVD